MGLRLTEQPSLYDHLETKSVAELLHDINNEDKKVPLAIEAVLPDIERLVNAIEAQIRAGGRFFWLGAGTGGKLGVLLEVEGEIPADLKLLDVCMHITVYDPLYATSKEIPAERIAKEKEVLAESEDVKSKPEAIRPKIIDGKIAKWFKEVCLMDQPWFNDEKTTLGKIAPKMTVKRFVRWKVGQDL